MKYYAPNYYPSFACIADKCRHSCCVGWEIDIDEDTLDRYDSLGGEIGKLLQKNIDRSGDTACFRLTDGDRCPFLDARGLCQLILTLGEDALCQICREHPRFYNVYGAREETGIGMACEEGARLILSQEEDTELILLSDDGEDEIPWEAEVALIALREQLFTLLQDRTRPLAARIQNAFSAIGAKPISTENFPGLIKTLGKLEKQDPAWQTCLDALENPLPEKDLSSMEKPLEKAMLYFVYRHLSLNCRASEEEKRIDLAARLRFAQLGVEILARLAKATDLPLTELARRYSTEIEYSEENTETLLTLLRNA